MLLNDSNFSRNSRVILALGKSSFECLHCYRVAVFGLSAVGSELIKSLILTNVGHIEVFDDSDVQLKDVGSNFFARMEDIGKKKTETILPRLKELNNFAHLEKCSDALCEEVLLNYDAFIVCQPMKYSLLQKFSTFCHKHNICFICTYCIGPVAGIFEDFTDDFTVKNKTGKHPFKYAIREVSKNGMLYLRDEEIILEEGTHIKFESADACPALNDMEFELSKKEGFKELTINKKLAEIGEVDSSKSFGYIIEVFQEEHVSHKMMEEKLSDDIKDSFIRDAFISLCKELDKSEEFPKIIPGQSERFCIAAAYEYPPVAAAMGSVAAHHVIMFQTQTYMPIREQWMFVNYISSLSKETPVLTGTRYDSIISTIGNKMFDKVHQSTLLVIGAGAVGCEYARDLALVAPKKIIIYDHDNIEPSNLTRQFLYKESSNGKMKAEVAAEAIKQVNSDIEVEGITEYFDNKSAAKIDLHQFNAILSGVDTTKGRFFASMIARILKVPFVNCGAEKASADGEIIIPFYTSLYEKLADEDNDIRLSCTLKLHPTQTSHCVQWYKSVFDKQFNALPRNSTNPKNVGNDEENTYHFLEKAPKTFNDCANFARTLFEEEHVWSPPENEIVYNAVYNPEDELHALAIRATAELQAKLFNIKYTKEDIEKAPFNVPLLVEKPETSKKLILTNTEWHNMRTKIMSGLSISPFEYNKDDITHLNFMYAMTNIRAKVYGLPPMQELEVMRISGNIAATMATTGTVIGAMCIASLIESFDEESIKADGFFRGSLSVDLSSQSIDIFKSPRPRYKLFKKSKTFLNQWEPEILDEDIPAYDFCDSLEEKYEAEIYDIAFQFNGKSIPIPEDMKDQPMKEVYKSLYGEPVLDYVPLDFKVSKENSKVPLFYLKLK